MTENWVIRTLAMKLLMMCGIQMIRPMVSYRALELGGSTTDLGIIAASYAFVALVLAVPTGRWVDRFGEPRFIVAGSVAITAVAVWLMTIDSLLLLTLSQGLLGFGQLAVAMGAQALLASAGPPSGRDSRLGIMTVVNSAGQMIGPALAGVLAGTAGGSPMPVFVAAAGGSAIGVLLGVSVWLRPPAVHEARSGDRAKQEKMGQAFAGLVRTKGVPNALLASLTVLASIDILIAYLPAYGEARGLSVTTVGILLSARAAASMVSRVFMLPMLRWLGRRRLLLLSIVLPTVAVPAIALTGSEPVLLALMVVAGFGLGLGQPLTLVWIANQVAPEVRGTAFGIRVSGNRVGQVVVPAAAGLAAGATGLWAVFLLIGVLLAISAAAVTRAELADEPAPRSS